LLKMIKHSIRYMARGFVAHKRGAPPAVMSRETIINTGEELLEFLRKEGVPVGVPKSEKKVTTDAQFKSL